MRLASGYIIKYLLIHSLACIVARASANSAHGSYQAEKARGL